MSGEYTEKGKIGKENGLKVLIVKGGWSCNAGYMVWAYVAKDNEKDASYAKTPYEKYVARIGEKVFEPENKLGSKHDKELLDKCFQFVKDKGYFCDTVVTMKTD